MLDERIINRWLDRGQRFFRAVTRNATIRGALQSRGLTPQELSRGWELYASVIGMNQKELLQAQENIAATAMLELDAWDAPNFNLARAVLNYRTPAATTYLFTNLQASQGPQAVVAVKTFLERWEALRSNRATDVPPEEASRAVALWADRGIIDPEKAARLNAWVDEAQRGQPTPTVVTKPAAHQVEEATFEELRAWLHEWREVARTSFSRRDYLIALGLASRRATTPSDESGDDLDVVTDAA